VLLLAGVPGESGAASLAHREVLPSGLVLLVAERPAVPIVTATLLLQAGAVFDPPGKSGVANLSALMLTQGTTTKSATAISEAIEFVGGSLDVTAGHDTTRLSFSVLSKDLDLALDIMADLLISPTFPTAEFAKKVPEVLAGIKRKQEDPGTVAAETFSSLIYGGHPYGRPTDGTEASVSAISREDLVAFQAARYRPNGAILAVAGDVRLADLKRRLEGRLRGWLPGGLAPVAPPAPATPMARVTKALPRTVTQANIVFGLAGIPRDHPDYYALFVMNHILGGGFNSRITQKIREEKGWAYDAGSSVFAGKYAGEFSVRMQTKNDSAREAIEAALAEIRRMREQPVSVRELADAKAFLTGSFPLRLDTSAKLAGLLAAIEQHNLGLDYVERYPQIINAITAAAIQRVARTHLDPERIALAAVADLSIAKLPE
jgi:zinc protease